MRCAKILIADDDRLIVATVEAGLKQAGYKVISATTGTEAIEKCSQEMPDLAILDMRLPDMTGVDTARKISGKGADIEVPFIFLSAYDDPDIVNQAVESGALGYLMKPIDVNRMVPSIEAALSRATELKKLKMAEINLTTALASGRETSIAIGLIMERYRLSEDESFDLLRYNARSQRRKLIEVASSIVRATESINLPRNSRCTPKPNPKSTT